MHSIKTSAVAAAAVAAGFGGLFGAPRAQAAMTCEELGLLTLPDTVIHTAERIDSGRFSAPGAANPLEVPAICRIAGTVSPAIEFEVWLPEDTWNGRFQAVGGGGLAGVISYGAMAGAVRAGYASASTDTGHKASESAWLYDRQRQVDYGYRAIHEMTVKAKAIIEARYGTASSYDYFNGCSTGGRQGLMEAQRFPEDYDGIVSGAPVNTFTHLHMAQLWTAHATLATPGAALDRDDLAMVMDAALEQCDANDGVEDGIITDPRTCHFDPKVLACNSGQTDACLAAPQIKALEMIYRGPANPRTGAPIYPGLEPGGEGPQPNNPGWALIMNGKEPFPIDHAVLGAMGFGNPDWDWRGFDFDHDVDAVDGKLYGVLNAINPDLRAFKAHGGKLIVYHGWSDPGVMPQRTVDFHQEIVDYAAKATGKDGRAFTDEYLRLFMMPGMGHCRGGNGPDQADFMGAIASWVEGGQAPTEITARKEVDGKVTMTRKLCPHPQVARYKGRGDTNDEGSFECVLP
jgi:Tannase and feruloyl esterase